MLLIYLKVLELESHFSPNKLISLAYDTALPFRRA
jgi:hypothetical protein